VDNYNPAHTYTFEFLLEIFHFFMVILVFSLINEFLIKRILRNEVKIITVVGWSLWTFLLLSTIIFYIYNYLGNWHDYHLKSYLEFIVNCTGVLIFPTIGVFFYFRHQSLKTHIDPILTSKNVAMNDGQLITFEGQGSNDRIILSLNSFLYGQAQDNYVALYYQEKHSIQKFLIRSSLSRLIDSIDHPAIIRNHRSYMVNLFHITAVKGGSSELKLHLKEIKDVLPVSKS